MYLGDLIEIGTAEEVHDNAVHPYTRALLTAIPQPDPSRDRTARTKLQGEIPSPLRKPSGCPFHPRCPIAQPDCSENKPALEPKKGSLQAACPYADGDSE
jgi:oligopeptide/dipeptide ABC transporter ATP-binding protein